MFGSGAAFIRCAALRGVGPFRLAVELVVQLLSFRFVMGSSAGVTGYLFYAPHMQARNRGAHRFGNELTCQYDVVVDVHTKSKA